MPDKGEFTVNVTKNLIAQKVHIFLLFKLPYFLQLSLMFGDCVTVFHYHVIFTSSFTGCFGLIRPSLGILII
jgi:hypothetical protein